VTLEELRARAHALTGRSLTSAAGLHTKGKTGTLIEELLGATGKGAVHDFPELGVELKTVPVDGQLRPRESTYVCRISLAEAERAEWETSWVRSKLSHVLFIPICDQVIGTPVFWKPSSEQDRALRDDFDELMGLIGRGRIEDVTAHEGQILQLRPKARDGSVRTQTFDRDGELVSTVPRGFYLRARFVGDVLRR
jgi:DNA mismatch repair protein MutH